MLTSVVADGRAFVAHPTSRSIAVVDLDSGAERLLALPLSDVGPTYLAVSP